MAELKKRFFFCNRWFEYQRKKDNKEIYEPIPKNGPVQMRIEFNNKTYEMGIFFFEDNKKEIIKLSDITQPEIKCHYLEEKSQIIEVENQYFDDIQIELFATINNFNADDYEIEFKKDNKKRNCANNQIEFPLPLEEKIKLHDLEFDTQRVLNFKSFVNIFSQDKKKLLESLFPSNLEENTEDFPDLKQLVIPNSLEVYDRVYTLIKIQENNIILRNNEEGIRNLEIKVDPDLCKLLKIHLKIIEPKKMKSAIEILKNDNNGNGIIVRYHNKNKDKMKIGYRYIEVNDVSAKIIFDKNNHQIEKSVIIKYGNEKMELIQHPTLNNNYVDEKGNLYTIGNIGYSIFVGLASYAPNILYSVEKKLFKVKE